MEYPAEDSITARVFENLAVNREAKLSREPALRRSYNDLLPSNTRYNTTVS